MSTTRRSFVKAAGGAAAMAALGPAAKVRGANDDVRIAIIGVGGKGGQHIGNFAGVPGVRVVTICDADRSRTEAAAKRHEAMKLAVESDLRRVLDDANIDAVCVATPNHWHALATVWACAAGKDVYVEKPCSHDVWEGRQMVAAARRHGRIVQVGTQRRSDPGWASVIKMLRDGELGAIRRVRVPFYSGRGSIGRVDGPMPVPPSVDYGLWAGPAPMDPIMRRRFHYDWHWFWSTGNGELGNNGPHLLDLARWAIGAGELPRRVVSIGGRFGWEDSGQTPNTHLVCFDYDPAPIVVEVRNLPASKQTNVSDTLDGVRAGLIIECEGGSYRGLDGGAVYDPAGRHIRKVDGDGGRNHPANFVEAVRSRRVGDLACDIAEGHLSTALCHIGNVSHRVGAARSPDQIRDAVEANATLDEATGRLLEHLAANEIDAARDRLTLGTALTLDPPAQRFTGPDADTANALLRRAYRPPFVMPEPT